MPNPPLPMAPRIGAVTGSRLVKLIEVETKAGEGSLADPVRRVVQWWTLDGVLLAERDPWREQNEADRG